MKLERLSDDIIDKIIMEYSGRTICRELLNLQLHRNQLIVDKATEGFKPSATLRNFVAWLEGTEGFASPKE